ncbi:hypothetical protein predicted by Glimmer/Critica [Sorangium cellulosum So ce56]|uniref:Uncharacterized protein n=1 Tax=Sorangium cellulosum (strain So ce56) TaxID=448385 RepID=A9EW23_SORC5|nr:hypothetical protein predicted by Glimmer/Critica [Sorangium cellulosum So ce56]
MQGSAVSTGEPAPEQRVRLLEQKEREDADEGRVRQQQLGREATVYGVEPQSIGEDVPEILCRDLGQDRDAERSELHHANMGGRKALLETGEHRRRIHVGCGVGVGGVGLLEAGEKGRVEDRHEPSILQAGSDVRGVTGLACLIGGS